MEDREASGQRRIWSHISRSVFLYGFNFLNGLTRIVITYLFMNSRTAEYCYTYDSFLTAKRRIPQIMPHDRPGSLVSIITSMLRSLSAVFSVGDRNVSSLLCLTA